jgi:Nodulation protein S (NodS)
VRDLAWADIAPPLQQLLASYGIQDANLRARLAALRQRNRTRVTEGDRDHLIYYLLQATAFTTLPPIEPALSARTFLASGRIPADAKARIDAFAAAARNQRELGARMAMFRTMLARDPIDLGAEYARAMKFAAPVGALYHERGLSTDTTVDAGYVVHLSLSALRQLQPERRIRTVLIIGPGLDLAPRTGLLEAVPPQSVQPFAVADALLSSGLSTQETLRLTAADINPRVTEWVRAARGTRPMLALIAGVQDQDRVRLSEDYREYFSRLGKAIGTDGPLRGFRAGRLAKSIAVHDGITDTLDAATLDITVERIDERFDLIVATNVFPYLTDAELMLAIANTSGMLNPGGVLIHNEPRPALADALLALEMPLLHSRSGIVANVDAAPPLYDTVWMHEAPRR